MAKYKNDDGSLLNRKRMSKEFNYEDEDYKDYAPLNKRNRPNRKQPRS